MKSISNKFFRIKFLPEILFISLCFFTYAPHFIYCWYPQILNDTYAYVFLAKDIYEGKLPLVGHRMDLPYGYAMIMAFIFKLGGSLKTLILIQTIVNIAVFTYLIRVLKKINTKLALAASFTLWLYISSTQSLLWNTTIYTESFYSSNLVLATIFIICFFIKKEIKYIYLLGLTILIGFMMRSNGLYLFFIPGLLGLYSLFRNKKLIPHIILATTLALLTSSTFNSTFKNTWFPSETLRIYHKITGKGEYFAKNETDDQLQQNLQEYKKVFSPPGQKIIERKRSEQTWKLLTHLSNSNFGQHYYYRMPKQIRKFNSYGIEKEMNDGHYLLRYKTTSEKPEEFVKFFLTNIEESGEDTANALNDLNIDKKPRVPWLFANHILDLSLPLSRNPLTVIIFYTVFFFSLIKFLKSANRWESPWFMILFVSGIHLFSIALLGASNVSNNAYPRYAYVSEFIGYLTIVLGIYYWRAERKSQKLASN